MKLKISFKNIEHTPSLDTKIEQKTQKLTKYFNGHTEVQWTCSTSKHGHKAEVKIIGPAFVFHATGKAGSLYQCLDIAVAKIDSQIKKRKEKLRNRLHQNMPANVLPFKRSSSRIVSDSEIDELQQAS